jgi:hypothetical protein
VPLGGRPDFATLVQICDGDHCHPPAYHPMVQTVDDIGNFNPNMSHFSRSQYGSPIFSHLTRQLDIEEERMEDIDWIVTRWISYDHMDM